MTADFNLKLANSYKNNSQIARVLTEDWVLRNSYCPNCGKTHLNKFENNRPAADFFCSYCKEEFELKSKKGKLPNKITDGAYSTMIERINSKNNPNFFFLTYSKKWSVENFLVIPKQFFTEEIIIKRHPLSETAKRAGWIGCNIDISKIAEVGKVFLLKNTQPISPQVVTKTFENTLFLREKKKETKSWLLDILRCIDSIHKEDFTLEEIYRFEKILKIKYPNNNFIKDKIRQQLQILRDKGIIEFKGKGHYKKVDYGNI